MTALGVAAALLAGCSDAESVTPAPEATTAAGTPSESAPAPTPTTTTAAPSADAPERPTMEEPAPPEAMSRDNVEGAEAAALYFLELYPYVYATGDLRAWEEMSDPECQFCQSVIRNASELHSRDGYGMGGEFTITAINSRSSDPSRPYVAVWVDAEEGPSTRVDAAGVEGAEHEGGFVEFDFALYRSDTGWVVRGVETRSQVNGDL